MKNVNFNDLLNVYDLEVRKNCRNKKKIYIFEKNKMQNLSIICDSLENNTYIPSKYNIFLIKDPKYRVVMSLPVADKIVNHYLSKYILIPKLDHYLSNRMVATRKGYGLGYGIKLVKKYLEKNKIYNDFYVLKLDIKKYFYNINHDVLKNMIRDKLDIDEYEIIERIIDSTDFSYINDEIEKEKNIWKKNHKKDISKIDDIPFYKKGLGLSLGAMSSQFLSVFYMYPLINFIVHKLHLKYTVVYMDDIIIIHHDKEYLKKSLIEIEKKIENDLKLELNKKKTKIVNIKEGFEFIGYKFIVKDKKTILKIRKSTLKKIKKRCNELRYLYKKGKINFNKVFCSLNTYLHGFKFASNLKVMKIIRYHFWVD